MNLGGVHHVSLNVSDTEVAGRFYTEVLGLEVLPRPDFGFPGAWLYAGEHAFVHLVGIDGVGLEHRRVVGLKAFPVPLDVLLEERAGNPGGETRHGDLHGVDGAARGPQAHGGGEGEVIDVAEERRLPRRFVKIGKGTLSMNGAHRNLKL